MLLELLSDFQISIPELGRVEATTHADRAAHLEQLARADRGAQAPLPVPVARLPRRSSTSSRSSACTRPSSTSTVARKLVEVVAHGARARPQEAAVDRRVDRLGARAAAARRRGHRREVFTDTMSIIVKHRTDLDVVAERVGVKLGCEAASMPPRGRAASRTRGTRTRGAVGGTPQGDCPAAGAHILEFGEELRGEGVAVGTCELLDAFARRCARSRGPSRRTSARRWPRRSPSRQEDRRVFDLVFDRFFFRAAELAAVAARACARPGRAASMDEAGDELNLDALRRADRRRRSRDGDESAHARPRAPGDRRLRAARARARA